MITYKLAKDRDGTDNISTVIKIDKKEGDGEDGGLLTYIPFNEDNTDYQEYLAWVAEGNTADPADE